MNHQPQPSGGVGGCSEDLLFNCQRFSLIRSHPFGSRVHFFEFTLTFIGAVVDGGDGGEADTQEVMVTFVTSMTTSDMSGEEDEGTEGSSASLLSLPSMLCVMWCGQRHMQLIRSIVSQG